MSWALCMSGIAGQLLFGGQEVARRDLERVANALRPHGPDRSAVAVTDHVGLVHVLMRITPEDYFDDQPLRGFSGAIITADLRLDNRDDILRVAGVTPHDALTWPDSRILLAAWEKVGDEIWTRLRGPFAVAIWDPRCQSLILARDHLGLNVVTWYKSQRFFAFATMPKGLFALSDVPRTLNEQKFADFLVLNHADHSRTYYHHIYRVPPGHVARVTRDGAVRLHRYWSPADIKPIRLPSDQAYADGLRECLDRSVRRQMRSAHGIGSHLSGGLDSSSVSILAARALREENKRLAAFTQVPSADFDGAVAESCYADETPYVEAIRSFAGNIDVTYIRNDTCDDFAELEKFFVALEGPVRNPTALGWILAIQRSARSQGRRVLLGGFFGNVTISWDGWPQTVGHLFAGRLGTAFRQWCLFYRHSPYSRWSAFRKLIVEAALPDRVARWLSQRRSVTPWAHHSAIRADFAVEMGVESRAQRLGHDFLYRSRTEQRAKSLTSIDYVGDWFAAEKAVTGVESRDPTADIDVISFCFGIPPEQYLVENIDRSLIRRSMWGLLPEAIVCNRRRGLQSADWYKKLDRRRHQFEAELVQLSKNRLTQRCLDIPRLERALRNWPSGAWHRSDIEEEYHYAFARGVAAARFLNWIEVANR